MILWGCKLINELVHTVWGDPRNGTLNIWYARHSTDGTILSMDKLVKETYPEIILYPNPSKETVTLDFLNVTSIHLYDRVGTMLQQHKISEHKNHFQMDIHKLPSGVYYIVCDTPAGVLTKKLIRE